MSCVCPLRVYDPFSSDWYDINGEFATLQEAETVAREELQDLDISLPSGQGGGQDGIQDRMDIIHPTGQCVRFGNLRAPANAQPVIFMAPLRMPHWIEKEFPHIRRGIGFREK